MMKCQLVLALLFIGILWCEGRPLNCSCNPTVKYDHLKLSLMWPNSYCWTGGVQCRSSIPQYFVVKSLWAESGPDRPKPYTDCDATSAIPDSAISVNKFDLLKYWPDLTTFNYENSKPMWASQWKKYGSCISGSMATPEYYFSNTLQLRDDHNLYQILKRAGIVANGNTYTAEKILTAVRKATTVIADVVCETDRDGNVFLSQIHQCISNDGKTFVDCQGKIVNCDKEPIFADQYYG